MKRIIIGSILSLPLVIAALPAQKASAFEIILNPHRPRVYVEPVYPAPVYAAPVYSEPVYPGGYPGRYAEERYERRVWIPAHWEDTRYGREWVRGYYEYR